jgi:hypothetical protein
MISNLKCLAAHIAAFSLSHTRTAPRFTRTGFIFNPDPCLASGRFCLLRVAGFQS